MNTYLQRTSCSLYRCFREGTLSLGDGVGEIDGEEVEADVECWSGDEDIACRVL